MYCQKCGGEITEGLAFCPNCGAPVAPQPKYAAPEQNTAQGQYQPYEQTQYQTYQQPYQQQPYQQPPYQQPPYQQPAPPAGTAKSRLAAGLLAILLGTFGAHNFYLGFTKRALIQLLVSVLSFGFGAPVIAVWALIEGIFYLTSHEGYTTDANGVPLTE